MRYRLVTKLSNRALISLWAVPTPTGSVSCRRTFRTDLAFQNLVFSEHVEERFDRVACHAFSRPE